MKFNNLKAVQQGVANIALWACVAIVMGGVSMIQGGDFLQPFPLQEFEKLFELTQLLTFLGAGLIYFAIFCFVRHKYASNNNRLVIFIDFGLDEVGSALYSFGSLLLIACIFFGLTKWYLLGGIFCFVVGYNIKPNV